MDRGVLYPYCTVTINISLRSICVQTCFCESSELTSTSQRKNICDKNNSVQYTYNTRLSHLTNSKMLPSTDPTNAEEIDETLDGVKIPGIIAILVFVFLGVPVIFFMIDPGFGSTMFLGSLLVFSLLVVFFLGRGPVQQQLRRRREAAATIATAPSLHPQQSQSDALVELSTPLMQPSTRLEDTSQDTEDILIV